MHGDGSLYLRGKTWWMKFYRDGRPITKSCKTSSQDTAKRKLQAEMRKRDDELLEPRHARVTIEDLVKASILHYEANGLSDFANFTQKRWDQHLAPVFKTMKAHRFGSADQHAYRAQRLKEGAAPATINRELQVLRKAFRLGAEAEPPTVRRVPKFQFTKEDNARKGFLNRTQVEDLKAAAAKHSLGMRALVEAAHILGWRRGELVRLRIADVHLDTNTLRLEETKNGDVREVSMPPGLRTLIDALIVGRGQDEPLFGITLNQFDYEFSKVRKAAGLEGYLFHDLRRTSARSKRAAGIDTSLTMAIMGWRTEKMFRRYGIVATEDTGEALAKVEQFEAKSALTN